MVKVYSDGAYSSSRNQGGWAFVILENGEKLFSDFGSELSTTNNRMEIISALNAILYCKANDINNIMLYSDSMYLIGTMTKNWKKNKNIDLWDKMFGAVSGINIEWMHTKGHSGDKWNEHCDMLAVHGSHINIIECSEQ